MNSRNVAADSLFNRWLLPGLLFQSVLIGGGCATGRELVAFFLVYGPAGGLLGTLTATASFSLVAMLFFEFARLTRSATYMDIFKHLLGRGWFLYEIGYVMQGIFVLALMGAAAGAIAERSLGLGDTPGTLILCGAIIVLVFFGTFIETGTAVIHAINERLAETFAQRGRPFQRWHRSAVALVFLVLSIYLATSLGLVKLIAHGYGTMTWYFIGIFIVPLLTIGAWRVVKRASPDEDIPL